MPQVIDRTRPAKFRKGCQQALRYEVVLFHTERDWDEETGVVLAKFAAPGDAHLWARTIREGYRVVVRN